MKASVSSRTFNVASDTCFHSIRPSKARAAAEWSCIVRPEKKRRCSAACARRFGPDHTDAPADCRPFRDQIGFEESVGEFPDLQRGQRHMLPLDPTFKGESRSRMGLHRPAGKEAQVLGCLRAARRLVEAAA